MLSRTLDNDSNATATHATHAIADKFKAVRIARIARVQVAPPTKTFNLAGEVDTDNFILNASPKAQKVKPLEADSLMEILQALGMRKEAAWVRRQSTGTAKIQGRYIQFDWAGCSDLLGMLKNGRLLAVECKRAKGGRLSTEQAHVIAMVNQFGGCAFVATSAMDVFNNLGTGHE